MLDFSKFVYAISPAIHGEVWETAFALGGQLEQRLGILDDLTIDVLWPQGHHAGYLWQQHVLQKVGSVGVPKMLFA